MAAEENNLNAPDVKPEKGKFTGSLFFYVLVFMCVNIAAFVFFMLKSPSQKHGYRVPDISGYSNAESGTHSILLISEIKTHDIAAQNLYRYVMNNPVKPENREQTAKNLQESGIDLYQENLEMLADMDENSDEVRRDIQTLRSYCSLNKELFEALKSSVEDGKDPSYIESSQLRQKIDSLSEEVQEIYDSY